MSDVQPDPSWWQASDDKWYPPELHPSATPPAPPPPEQPAGPAAEKPTGPTVIGTPGVGASEVAERERKGIEGERATSEALSDLPSSYRVAHGLKIGTTKGDIDHLVIGPSGVWVIDSKNWSGSLSAGKGTLWRGRRPIRREVASVENQAAYAQSVLGLDTNPTICFITTRLPRPAQMVGRCRAVSLDVLVPYIEGTPTVLTPEQVDAAWTKVEAWAVKPPVVEQRGAALPVSSPAKPTPTKTQRRRSTQPKRRTTSAPRQPAARPARSKKTSSTNWGALVVGLLGLLAIFGFLNSPDLIESVAEPIADFFTPTTVPPPVVAGTSTTAAPAGSASTPTTVPNPGLFTASVSCPPEGGGYTIAGRAPVLMQGRIRITVTIAGESRFLGEIPSFHSIDPVVGVAPSQGVRFDIQSVDPSGQAGESYPIDVVTPEAPC